MNRRLDTSWDQHWLKRWGVRCGAAGGPMDLAVVVLDECRQRREYDSTTQFSHLWYPRLPIRVCPGSPGVFEPTGGPVCLCAPVSVPAPLAVGARGCLFTVRGVGRSQKPHESTSLSSSDHTPTPDARANLVRWVVQHVHHAPSKMKPQRPHAASVERSYQFSAGVRNVHTKICQERQTVQCAMSRSGRVLRALAMPLNSKWIERLCWS